MNLQEKKAVQMVIMDEITMRQESDPTLLLDILMSGDGPAFVRQILAARAVMGRNLVAMNEHLLRALDGQPAPRPELQPTPDWQSNGAAAEE